MMSVRDMIKIDVAYMSGHLSTRMNEVEIDIKRTVNGFIPNMIHSRDAAVVHLRYSGMGYGFGLTTAASIHDSFGFKRSEREEGINEVQAAMGEVANDRVGERMIVNHESPEVAKAMAAVKSLMIGARGITTEAGMSHYMVKSVLDGAERREFRIGGSHPDQELVAYRTKVSRGVRIPSKRGMLNT